MGLQLSLMLALELPQEGERKCHPPWPPHEISARVQGVALTTPQPPYTLGGGVFFVKDNAVVAAFRAPRDRRFCDSLELAEGCLKSMKTKDLHC